MRIRPLQQVPWQPTVLCGQHLAECFRCLEHRVSHSCLFFFFFLNGQDDADMDAVYNNLNYHWATSLLGFLTLAMTPFP